MKSLLKFSLLAALIISGKLTKQAAPATVAHTATTPAPSVTPVVLVHQVLTSGPVHPSRTPLGGHALLSKMF